MSQPYIGRANWPSFDYRGTNYAPDHLDEYIPNASDTAGSMGRILVTFSDHCFTRTPIPRDGPALLCPASERAVGYFCSERYTLSLDIRDHLERTKEGQVWNVAGENVAAIPTVDRVGTASLYTIVFSLDRATGLRGADGPLHLLVRVRSAHPADEHQPTTFGQIRSRNLVALRMQNKRAPRTTSAHRKIPRMVRQGK